MWHAAQWMSKVLDYDYRKNDLFSSQHAVVLCARDYLEHSFRQALEVTYGDIDLYECLISFIQSNDKIAGLQSIDDRLVDGVSAWPLIFHALRAGDTDLALNIIQKAKLSRSMLFSLSHVQALLESYQSKEVSIVPTTTTKSSNLRNIEYSLFGNPSKRFDLRVIDRSSDE